MKKLLIIGLVLLVIAGIAGFIFNKLINAPNTNFSETNKLVQIKRETDYQGLLRQLESEHIIKDLNSFKKVASLMKYDKARIKSGQYKIMNGMSNKSIIKYLRRGKQIPVKLSFNNQRMIENLAGRITQNLEIDSTEFINYVLQPNTLKQYKKTPETILSLFIPNTYEVYWDITKEDLLKKMNTEQILFWKNKNRLSKVEHLGFTKEQIYTLASIVEKETQANVEKPRIAGVYLNRLKRNIPLQADPTVVFATKKFDLKRVLFKHLKYDSPYNTYMYPGLPPGPIYMPSISSIDAVLNPEKHKFLYFCARPDGSGQHAYAKTLTDHNNNAKRYQRWLTKNKF